MEVILLKDVDKVGRESDLVKVKAGYGRNYLIPQGFAIIANKSNLKTLAERKRISEARYARMMAKLQVVVDKLNASKLKVGAKVGQTGKIFGSITNVQLADSIKKQFGVEIDRKKIKVSEEIKMLGDYKASIDFHRDLKVDIEFEVVGE